MNALEAKISAFAKSEDVQMEALALMKVGREKGDTAQEIMARVLANALLRFHGIPVKIGEQN